MPLHAGTRAFSVSIVMPCSIDNVHKHNCCASCTLPGDVVELGDGRVNGETQEFYLKKGQTVRVSAAGRLQRSTALFAWWQRVAAEQGAVHPACMASGMAGVCGLRCNSSMGAHADAVSCVLTWLGFHILLNQCMAGLTPRHASVAQTR